MCRSIKTLRRADGLPSDEEIRASASQFVRLSGYRQPSRLNQEAFSAAVEEITGASRKLLGSLRSPAAAS